MRRLLAGAALALVSGGVAQADARDMIPELRQACRPGSEVPAGYGLIAAAKVRDVAHGQFPLPPGVWAEGVDAMAARATAPPPYATDEDRQLSRYRLIVETWSGVPRIPREPALEDAGLKIDPIGAGADTRARLVQLFKGDPSLRFFCPSPVPEPRSPTAASKGLFFVLVKQASDLDEADFDDGGELPIAPITKRSFAEVTYVDDREAHVQSWAVKLAVAAQWPELSWTAKDVSSYVKFNPRLFVSYDRQGENDPNADGYVNNLDFGAQVSGRFGFGPPTYTGYYAVSGSYRTDDDFRSEAYAVEVALDPPMPDLPYHRGYKAIGQGPVAIDFKWGVNLAADWVQVDDAGRRMELVDQAEYFRLGYDTGFDLRFGPAGQEWRLLLSVDYGLRDGQTKDGGDAQMFTSSLLFLDRAATNWSFGLSYERGENLQSLETSELWKLVLGARF